MQKHLYIRIKNQAYTYDQDNKVLAKEKKDMKHEEAEIGLAEIGGVVLTFVVVGIIAAIGLNIMSTTKTQASIAADPNATQAINDAVKGVGNITTQMPLMGLAIGGAAILTIILGVFAFSRMR